MQGRGQGRGRGQCHPDAGEGLLVGAEAGAGAWAGRTCLRGCRQRQRRGIRVWMTQVTLGVACVVQPPLGDGRACDCSMEHVRHFEDGEGGEVAAEGPTDDAHSSRVDVCRVEVSQRGDGSGLVLERRRREVVVHAAVPHGPTSWGATAVGDGDDEAQVGNVSAWG